MSYEDYRDNRMQQPTDAWLGRGHADMGVDEVCWNPDGSVTAIQYKRTSRHLPTGVRMNPEDLLVDCPDCAGQHGPAHGDLSANNLTVAASGAYFRDMDPARFVLIDYAVYEGSSTVDLHEVLRGLTPDPANSKKSTLQVLEATHPDADHLGACQDRRVSRFSRQVVQGFVV